MTNPIETLAVVLLTLTMPQRKALGAHLEAFGQHASTYDQNPAITWVQAHGLALRILSTAVAAVTPQDMAVLEAAVYLSPARDLISARELNTLERAWTKLGWTWTWLGQGFDPAVATGYPGAVDLALKAEDQIRAILNPAPPMQIIEPAPAPAPAQGTEQNPHPCPRCGFPHRDGYGKLAPCPRLTRPDNRVRAPGWTEPGPPITPLFTHLTQGAVLWVLEALIAAGCEIRYLNGSVILTPEAALDVLLKAVWK